MLVYDEMLKTDEEGLKFGRYVVPKRLQALGVQLV